MLKKRFLSAVVSTLFLFIALTPAALAAREASATPESMVSIQYVYINQASTSLTISASGTATVNGYVQIHLPGETFIISLCPIPER